MYQSVSDAHYHPAEQPLRMHMIGMLDHVIWLTQWSASVAVLPRNERQALEQHLAELDAELRNAISHSVVQEALASET
jgi:hypothetical protein